jgi:predicted Zn-dependent protease
VAANAGSPTSHLWLALFGLTEGRLSEAERAYRRLLDLDPLSGVAYFSLAECLLAAGRTEEALHLAERSLELGVPVGLLPGVLANVQLKRFDAADRMLDGPPAGTSSNMIDGLKVYVAASKGQQTEARRLLSRLLAKLPRREETLPLVVPYVYVALGEQDAAVQWVAESRQAGEFLAEHRLMPEMRTLAGHTKMRELIRMFDLPATVALN